MSRLRVLVASVAAFVVLIVADCVLSRSWFGGPFRFVFANSRTLFCTETVLAIALTLAYPGRVSQGRSGFRNGLRFGVIAGLLAFAPVFTMGEIGGGPDPELYRLKWMLGGLIRTTAAGLVLSLMLQPGPCSKAPEGAAGTPPTVGGS